MNKVPPDNTVRRASAGDAEAQAALWREHRPWLAAVVVAHMPREASLEDLLQETALNMVKSIHTLREPERIRSWLYRLAVNVAQSALRRRYPERGREHGSDGLAERTTADGSNAAAREAVQRAVEAVHLLPEMYREVILLRAVRGLSPQHIAAALQIPVRTVETRLLRARKLLSERAANDPAALDLRGST